MTPGLGDLPARLSGCRGVLVDSNIILDVAAENQDWREWSEQALAEVSARTVLIINPIIYAEVSIGYRNLEAVDAVLRQDLYKREDLPWEAAFLAGKCFLQYRRRGGLRTALLPDFLIGAHAAVMQLALLTRDPARYRTYFPTIEILAPKHRAA